MWLLIIVGLAAWGAVIYNDFTQRQCMLEQAWADLNLQLTRRRKGVSDDAIQDASKYYNALVRDYNTKLRLIPDRFIARAAKLHPKTLYEPAKQP